MKLSFKNKGKTKTVLFFKKGEFMTNKYSFKRIRMVREKMKKGLRCRKE